MPRHKPSGRGGRLPNPRRGGGGGGGVSQSSHNRTEGSQSTIAMTPFTMRDEARATAHRGVGAVQISGDKDSRLRSKRMNFVSAGLSEPVQDPAQVLSSESKEISNIVVADVEAMLIPSQSSGSAELPIRSAIIDNKDSRPYFIDTVGSKRAPQHTFAAPVIPTTHTALESATDSEDDVVLFRGRPNNTSSLERQSNNISLSELSTVNNNVQDAISTASQIMTQARDTETTSSSIMGVSQEDDADDSDALLADYIANIVDTSDACSDGDGAGDAETETDIHILLGQRDLGGRHGDVVIDSDTSEDVDSGHVERDSERERTGSETNLDDALLAEIIAKQEELGLGGDEPVLVSQNFPYVPPRSRRNIPKQSAGTQMITQKPRKARAGRPVSATAMANMLDNLGTAQVNTIIAKSKSRGGPPVFNLSDSEMEASLTTAWDNDRQRKKERKVEREEKRAAGLLGRNTNPNHPDVKYPTGMTLEQVKEELGVFLCGTAETLILPPMDARNRKVVHELANKFGLKSKSTGAGETRRPAMYRTNRTMVYDEAQLDRVFTRVSGRFLHRMDVKPSKDAKKPKSKLAKAGGGRGGNSAAYSYRDGEVVGASAPELAGTNKGRAMLEKMGWSNGMALGAEDNQGILQPVSLVVKRSKAGLG